MTPFEAVVRFAAKAEKRGLQFLQRSSSAVEVRTSDEQGFPVGLFAVEADLVMVRGGDWHEHFEDMEDALDCCAFLLSDKCRLKTIYRGTTLASCVVQSHETGSWVNAMSIGHFFVPFWKKKIVEFRQNSLISGDDKLRLRN